MNSKIVIFDQLFTNQLYKDLILKVTVIFLNLFIKKNIRLIVQKNPYTKGGSLGLGYPRSAPLYMTA